MFSISKLLNKTGSLPLSLMIYDIFSYFGVSSSGLSELELKINTESISVELQSI